MRFSMVHPDVQTKSQTLMDADEKLPKSTLHEALRNILLIGQILGQLPVLGVVSSSVNTLNFTWKSWKFAYCCVPAAGTTFVMLMLIIKMVTTGTNLFIITIFIFHFCNMGITLSFFYLATKWPLLMREWNNVEVHMRSYGWPKTLKFRIRLIAIVVLLLTAVDYATNLVSNVLISSKCKREGESITEYFYKVLTFPYIFQMLQFSIWGALLLQLLDLISAFTWSYADLFIMIMSSALALRFKQITSRLRLVADSKIGGVAMWKSLREDYNSLCKLCKTLDDSMSYIILLSFGTNLFFILIQLFNSLRPMNELLDKVHFFFSFGFLILRTVFVSFYAAWVNDESKKPVSILNSVPSSVYNLEIRRFIQQISFDSVALTGRNFFSVTRGLILSVAGAIVTYELVLIQFNENLLKKSNSYSGNHSCTFEF